MFNGRLERTMEPPVEKIVEVGVDYLTEGMRVTRMRQTEQAVPREDDPA